MSAEKILTLLQDSSSTKPVTIDLLVVTSELERGELETLLEKMYLSTPASINRAQVTKNGIQQMVYWRTGIVSKAERQHITINPRKLPPSGQLERKPTERKDNIQPVLSTVNTEKIMPIVNPPEDGKVKLKHVLEAVIGSPGIMKSELQNCLTLDDKSNRKQAVKTALNALDRNKISIDAEGRLHLGKGVESSLKRLRKAPAEKPHPVGRLVPFTESGEPFTIFGKPEKSTTQIMLELILVKGEVSTRELCNAAGTNSTAHLASRVKRGLLFAFGRPKRYKLAQGVTEEMLLGDFRGGRQTDKPVLATVETPPVAAAADTQELDWKKETLLKFERRPQRLQESVQEQVSAQQVFINTKGELTVIFPGQGMMVFSAPDTLRIQKLFLSINLESLCD